MKAQSKKRQVCYKQYAHQGGFFRIGAGTWKRQNYTKKQPSGPFFIILKTRDNKKSTC